MTLNNLSRGTTINFLVFIYRNHKVKSWGIMSHTGDIKPFNTWRYLEGRLRLCLLSLPLCSLSPLFFLSFSFYLLWVEDPPPFPFTEFPTYWGSLRFYPPPSIDQSTLSAATFIRTSFHPTTIQVSHPPQPDRFPIPRHSRWYPCPGRNCADSSLPRKVCSLEAVEAYVSEL
jgi:hypothetical protein